MRTYTLKPRGQEQTAIVQSRGAVIAEVYTDREPGDQHRTAALFATAPDLLENLRQLADLLESIGHDCTPAREVIARATGA